MLQTSVIELSQSALTRNLNFLKGLLRPGCQFCSVIKGNAYGHGIRYFVPMAEQSGVRRFAVFSADEAEQARNAFTEKSELIIMGHVDDDALAWAVELGIQFYVFDLERLERALELARKLDRPARLHLELETGLHRTGLEPEELPRALELLRRNRDMVQVEGVCTHLAGAESIGNHFRITGQLERFDAGVAELKRQGIAPRLRHAACSAAAIAYSESQLDLVRVGIAHYGFWPSQETRMDYFVRRMGRQDPRRVNDPLRRVMRWKSRVMSSKEVPANTFVGYGNTFLSQRPMRLASVPVGYFHGFTRSLSNLGHVLVRGRRAKVVGTVNMNMVTVDVTDIPGVERGDEVVIIGRQRKAHITVAGFSDLSQFLNYEVLVRLPSEIPREVVP